MEKPSAREASDDTDPAREVPPSSGGPRRDTSERNPVVSLGQAMLELESLARRDPGGRGLSGRVALGGLGATAFDMLMSRRIIIITGFCVRSARIGETDGPPGTLALAYALRGLGKRVVLVSDRYSMPLLRSGSKAASASFKTMEIPEDQGKTDEALAALTTSFHPTHVLAIERPGSAPDGHRYSMRGEILDDIAPSADRLFLVPQSDRSYATAAIGDGGNELGMGSLREKFMDGVSLGSRIFCSSPADHVLTAGISNWGAYALAAALSLLSGALLLRPLERERDILAAMTEAGAVDGCTRENALSVDGLPWDEYSKTLLDIYELTIKGLAELGPRAQSGG